MMSSRSPDFPADEFRREKVRSTRRGGAEARADVLVRSVDLLRASTARLARLPDLDQFLAELMRQMIMQLSGWEAQLFLYDATTRTLRASLGVSLSADAVAEPGLVAGTPVAAPFPVDITPAWSRLLAHRGAIYFDVEEDADCFWPGMIEWHRARGQKGSICVALVAGEEPLGMLGFICRGKQTFTEDELNLTNALAQQAGLAIVLGRLADQAKLSAVAEDRRKLAQQRVEELAAANRALRGAIAGLVSIDNLTSFLERMLVECMRTAGAGYGAIALIEGDEVRHPILFDLDGRVSDERKARENLDAVPITPELRSFAAELSSQDLSYAIAVDHPAMAESFRRFHQAQGSRAVRLVPLRAGDSLRGWMGLGFAGEGEQSADRIELLRGLGDQMAFAIELTRLAAVAKQAALDREREQAARDRARDLTAANEALTRALASLASAPDLSRVPGALLKEMARAAEADVAHWFEFDAPANTLTAKLRVKGDELLEGPTADEPEWMRSAFDAALTPAFAHLCASDGIIFVDHLGEPDPAAWPGTTEWHLNNGRLGAMAFVIKIGRQPLGVLCMAFRHRRAPTVPQEQLVRSLGNQFALTTELLRLADGARQAAVLGERNRIARDLHDTLAQGFTGVLAQLGAVEGALESGRPAKINAYLERAKSLARWSLAEARSSVHALRPEAHPGPLAARLRRMLAAMTHGTGLEAGLTESGVAGELGPAADWCVHKFVQEALANTVKHAEARTFRVELAWGEGFSACVEDDGRGFEPETTAPGLGLHAMRERALEAGGRLTTESRPGQGTRLCLSFPKSPDAIFPHARKS